MSTFRNRLWSKRGYLTFYWYYEGYKLSRCGNFGLVFSVLSRYPLAMLWCLLVRSDGRRGLAVRTDKKKEKNKSLRKTRQTNAPWWTMQNCNCTCLATLFHEGLWKTITIIIIVHDLENFNITSKVIGLCTSETKPTLVSNIQFILKMGSLKIDNVWCTLFHSRSSYGHFTTISGHFFTNHIIIFYKTKVQTVI